MELIYCVKVELQAPRRPVTGGRPGLEAIQEFRRFGIRNDAGIEATGGYGRTRSVSRTRGVSETGVVRE